MNICVFCSSRSNLPQKTFDQAHLFCERLAAEKDGFVYGGGAQGLMGYFANTLIELDAKTIGVMPEKCFPQEAAHQGLTELIYTADMMDRKRKMMMLSDAFVIFPGGIGTMDEAIEVLTWKTVYKFEKPIIFFNYDGFWDPFLAMLKTYEKTGLFYPETMKSFVVVDTVDALFEEIHGAR